MATLKTCFKCGVEKTLDAFYKHSAMGDGHLGKCKECTKKDVRENRANKLDYYLQYDQQRSKTPERKQQAAKAFRNLRKNHPIKAKARASVSKAVESGKLHPLPCWICGEKAEAHHPDYSMPLDVVWLCFKHHREAHKMVRDL